MGKPTTCPHPLVGESLGHTSQTRCQDCHSYSAGKFWARSVTNGADRTTCGSNAAHKA